MTVALDWVCGIGWSLAYVTAIIIGFRYKSYCIPRLSICMNLSWEFWVVISRMQSASSFSSGYFSQLLWLSLDMIVLLTWFLYDRELRAVTKFSMLSSIFIILFVWAYVYDGWLSSVFVINLVMSIEFVLTVGKNKISNSLLIALFKLIGTTAATVLNGILNWNSGVLWCGGCCLILDMWYIICLVNKQKEVLDEKIN
jgi:hypothetical protein